MVRVDELGPHHPARVADARPEAVAARLVADQLDPLTLHPVEVDTLSYARLADESARLARALRRRGLEPGDHIAVVCGNRLEMFVACWAALRSGLYCTPISTWLGASETAYIVRDTGARALLVDPVLRDIDAKVSALDGPGIRVSLGGSSLGEDEAPPDALGEAGFERWADVLGPEEGAPLDEEPEGSLMFYSSGTTGRPKGVRKPRSGQIAGTTNPLAPFVPPTGLGADSVYLSPAPLYHAAPLGWSLGAMRLGGEVVVLRSFDESVVLSAVERYRVTHMQVVPTMLMRLVRLEAARRDRFDLRSLRAVIHAAAPCPRHVKRAAIDWLGPIVHEYYSGTEGSGITYITAEEWLAHEGSVGRALVGSIHITDEAGQPVAAGHEGVIWFGGGDRYEYHGDSGQTDARRHRNGWTTLDDVGYLDEEGYLYLTDRRAHMIVSGGVNISPTEIEDVLTAHPAVDDAAAFGIPHDEHGEQVKAVVVLRPQAGLEVGVAERALLEHCRANLAGYKCPRSIDIVEALPRLPTGKLATRVLRDPYWEGRDSRLV